jgi:hypothetical protein
VDVHSVLPQSTITANQPYTGPVTLGYQLANLAPDANLTSFLAGNNAASLGTHAGDSFTWAIEGGANGVGRAPGAFTYVTSTSIDLSVGSTHTNSQLQTLYSGLTSTLNFVNGQIGSGVTFDKTSTPAGADGSWGTELGSDNWYGAGPSTAGVAIGSTQNFYALTTGGGGSSTLAQVYILNSLTLSADGTLSAAGGTAPVPLPAAVWLLGSGLLGLFGVGRRRSAAAVA